MGAYRSAISCGRPDEESALREYPHGLPVCPGPYTHRSVGMFRPTYQISRCIMHDQM